MRRFEMMEGGSAKFWEFTLDGVDLTVCFGRIGTSGQSKTKTFETPAKAETEAAKLVKEKTGKGYSEIAATVVSAQQAQSITEVVAKPAPTKTKGAKLAQATVTEVGVECFAKAKQAGDLQVAAVLLVQGKNTDFSVPVIDRSDAVPVNVPNAEFVFSSDDINQLPIFRGMSQVQYAPDLSTLPGWAKGVAKVLGHDPFKLSVLVELHAQDSWRADFWVRRFIQRLHESGAELWTSAQCLQAMDRAQLEKADVAHWANVLTHGYLAESDQENPIARGLEICVALRGAEFALHALLEVWELGFPLDKFGRNEHLHALRLAIASADAAEHAKLLAIAQAHHEGFSDGKKELVSYLFPHVEAFIDQAYVSNLSALGALSFDRLRQAIDAKQIELEYYNDLHLPALLLWVKRFGPDQALELAISLYPNARSYNRDTLMVFIERLHRPKLIEYLAALYGDRYAKALFEKLSGSYPEEAIRAGVEQVALSKSKDLEKWTIRFAASNPHALPGALAAMSSGIREKFAAQLKRLERDAVADSELPSILVNPPWLQKIKVSAVASINLPKLEITDQFEWQNSLPTIGANSKDWIVKEFERTQKAAKNHGSSEKRDREFQLFVLDYLRFEGKEGAKILDGADFQVEPEDHRWRDLSHLLHLPSALALRILNQVPTKSWYVGSDDDLCSLLATLGLAALPAALQIIQNLLRERIGVLMAVNSVRAVPIIANAARCLKRSRADAYRWLRRFPDTAALGLMPLAFDQQTNKNKSLRDSAQYCLRWMQANGLSDALNHAAKQYGSACEQTLAAMFATDPLHILPSKLPSMPSWFIPGSYPRPELRDGRPISVPASANIGMMIALSTLDDPYGGVEVVKETLSESSLAEFAWAVFDSWIDAGAPTKENFGFLILALLGNDGTARKLAPKIREWPGQSQHARAVTGLDILAAIGSDVALMHLNAIADRAKFKGLQERAKLKIVDVAEARGLTRDELADRLVPDLGLDEADGAKLDFGTRHFKIGFDESLKPYVSDAAGVRLKDLPKPIKTDDAKLAEAATERFKAIKKDAKAIASQQLARLEQAMVLRRRWTAVDFRLFFLAHPLMRFMAQRLLWGAYDGDQLVSAFRVAEDLSFADQNDASYVLSEQYPVGICHAFEMEKAQVLNFGEIFADYTILQPFRQLGREVYLLTEAEKTAHVLTRFATQKVATLSVMGLNNKGWQRAGAQDGGWVAEFKKRLPDGLEATLHIDPGTQIGDPSYEEEQSITAIEVRKIGTWSDTDRMPLGSLNSILMSEILRDVDLLPSFTKG